MTDKPRFILELSLSRTGTRFNVIDPTLINDKLIGQAWNMMNEFIIDMLDDLKLEVTDEDFREIFIEICYWLIVREMKTLRLMPSWEQVFKENLGTRKRGARISDEDKDIGS